MSLADVARGHAMQTRIYRVFQESSGIDILISPTVSVPPFPLEQLYVKEIDGVTCRLISPAGADLCAHLDRSPLHLHSCGLEPTGTPFALQICGPARSDKFISTFAHAIEPNLLVISGPSRPLPIWRSRTMIRRLLSSLPSDSSSSPPGFGKIVPLGE